MDSEDGLDTRESPEQERWGASHVLDCRATLIRVVQKSQNLHVPPSDSWLGRVDAKTMPFPASENVRLLATVAADNLREVDKTLRNRLPIYSLYSLIRSAIESSSIALWQLEAKSEDLAASRTLRIHRQNVASDRTLWDTVVRNTNSYYDELEEAVKAKHDALKGVNNADFYKAVQSTSVIRNVDTIYPHKSRNLDVFSGVEVWRLCSGVAHANQFSISKILERRPDKDPNKPAYRSSRLSFIAAFYSTALHRTNLAIDSFERRSQPRRNSR